MVDLIIFCQKFHISLLCWDAVKTLYFPKTPLKAHYPEPHPCNCCLLSSRELKSEDSHLSCLVTSISSRDIVKLLAAVDPEAPLGDDQGRTPQSSVSEADRQSTLSVYCQGGCQHTAKVRRTVAKWAFVIKICMISSVKILIFFNAR